MDYVGSPARHPDREQLRRHLLCCTKCSLVAEDLLRLRDQTQAETGWRGALAHLRGNHPNRQRYAVHLAHSLAARAQVALLRPFFLPAVRHPAVAWASSAVLALALVGVSVRRAPEPPVVVKGDGIRIDQSTQLDARRVAAYLQQFSRADLLPEQIEQLRQLTNQLESRLHGEDKLEEDAAYLLTLAGLFQRRYEVTGEKRALETRRELLERAEGLLKPGRP
jgi:hypothetical protein